MDFVVSKVAMSICALLVVSILGGVVGNDVLFREVNELDSILDDLSATLERCVSSACDANAIWRVPFLSDGRCVDIYVRNSVLSAKAGQQSAILRPAYDAHTWLWNGTELNRSSLEVLDSNAPTVVSSSGFAFEISTHAITFEDDVRMFAFVRATA